jgi:hypothetical protein
VRFGIMAAVFLVIVALAVGLGVGIGKKNHNKATEYTDVNSGGQSSDGSSGVQQAFPLGEYSFVTALRAQQTNCTSNSATWRCYPYSVYDAGDSNTANSSQATFNWVITNTSAIYATNRTSLVSDSGVPANLTISSTNNPFALTFTNTSLTYISPSSNKTATRYTFSVTLPKTVVPTPAITTNNAASECFFNSTVVTGSIYLDASRSYPAGDLAESTALGGFQQWPYALEISQVSPGGQGVPDCYEIANGGLGDRITTGLSAESSGSECVCEYRNF